MYINRFGKTVLLITLFLPTFILLLNQLILDGKKDDMLWDYLGALGWAIFMSSVIIWVNSKSKNLKFTTMNKWTKKVSASFLNRHYSNENERLIPMKGGVPIRVAPKGMFLVGLITEYDELAFVDLRPKHIAISLNESDQITTTDGVKIIGTVEVTTKVLEEDKFLIRLISNEDEEEKIFNSQLKKSVRKIISDSDWIDITIFKEDKYENIKHKLLKDMKGVDCCFTADEVMFINLNPSDPEFANILEQKRKAKEHAKFQEEKEKAQQQRIKIEHETEIIKQEHERVKETKETEHRIEITAKVTTAQIEQKNKEHAAELMRKKNEHDEKLRLIFEIVAKFPSLSERLILGEINPSGLQSMDEIKLKELELQLEKEKNINTVIEKFGLKMVDNNLARTQGQMDVFKAVASKTMGIDVKLPENTIRIEKDKPMDTTDEGTNLEYKKSNEMSGTESENQADENK